MAELKRDDAGWIAYRNEKIVRVVDLGGDPVWWPDIEVLTLALASALRDDVRFLDAVAAMGIRLEWPDTAEGPRKP